MAKTAKEYRLLSEYDLTLDDYKNMLNKQSHVCAICKQKNGDKDLFVDHDHITGEVRGLLCRQCNFGIGHFKDNPDLTSAATRYLMKFQNRSLI